MVIQSLDSEGETIQIYNMPCSHEEGKENDRNVIVEAKYIRGHSGEPKKASELVLKNVPKHFETTFVEPDETTTEIIVDPDGSKRIIVRKLTKTTQRIVSTGEFEGCVPDDIRSRLSLSGTTHDVILGLPSHSSFERHPEITESTIHATIESVSHRVIKKTRRIIKQIVIIDGQEHITEEVIEEPDEVEEFSESHPAVEYDISEAIPVETTVTSVEVSDAILEKPIEDVSTEASVPVIEVLSVQTVNKTEIQEPIVEEFIEQIIIKKETLPQENIENVQQPDIEVEPEISKPDSVKPTESEKIISEVQETEHVESTPIEAEPPALSEGENQPEQVFETITEAPVELLASEVDKSAPIEDIKVIWPYETPHIASHSTTNEITELPAPAEQDKESQDIWPQNLTIGSNIDFNDYSFNRTLEKSSDYLDNDSFVIIEPGSIDSAEESPIPQSRFNDEDPEDVQSIEQPTETDFEIIEPETEKQKTEPAEAVEKKEPTLTEIDEKLENPAVEEILPIKLIPEASRPTSPPQMATITIVKTMTFLEQEKINAQSMMIVTKEPLASPPADKSYVSQADRSLPEETLINSQIVQKPEDLDQSLDISQADRSMPEEIIQHAINLEVIKVSTDPEPKDIELPVEKEISQKETESQPIEEARSEAPVEESHKTLTHEVTSIFFHLRIPSSSITPPS